MTLGDNLVKVWEHYIKVSPVGSKERRVTSPTQYSDRLEIQQWKNLSFKRMREIYYQAPTLSKGIRKKSLDATRAGIKFETLDNSVLSSRVGNLIRAFEERVNVKNLFNDLLISTYVYGSGFALITFANDKGSELDQKPQIGAIPYSVTMLDTESVEESVLLKDGRLGIKYTPNGKDKSIIIHADRILHLKIDSLPHNFFGNSIITLLRNTIKSKIDIDIAVGDLMRWYSHGIYVLNVEDLDDNSRDEYLDMLKKHPHQLVLDGEDAKLDVKSGEAIEPKSFMDYIFTNISAALVMPQSVLKGIEIGRVTGSEISFSEYVKDISNLQEIYLKPLLMQLYYPLLTNSGLSWKYKITFLPCYVDELSESIILKNRVDAATSGASFLTTEEQREMLNKGQIEVDIHKPIEKKVEPEPKEEE